MPTPWLDIPLADYEQHMALPQVGQAKLIADQLAELLMIHRPSSVAIIGCAGGNGLDRIDDVERVVGVDINPRYIESARQRFAASVPALELVAADIQSPSMLFEPVDFIYAALLFEYVDLPRTMRSLRRHCRTGGVLAALIQLPHESMAAVSVSPYVSLQSLGSAMNLVPPATLREHAEAAGFREEACSTVASPAGKQFALQIFRT